MIFKNSISLHPYHLELLWLMSSSSSSLNCFEINCAWVIGQCTGGFDIIIIIYILYLIVVVDVVFIRLLLAIAHTKEGKFIASSYYCCCSCRWMRTKCLNANARCRVRDNFIAPSIDLECVCAVIFEIYIHHPTLSCGNFSPKTIKFQAMDTKIY